MCIIVAKTKGAMLPSDDTLKKCFDNNDDGAGFMYVKHGKVLIDKGYMTFKSFIKHFHKICKKNNDFKNKNLVIHFRIGTSGSNTAINTHPFPITSNADDMHKNYFPCDCGLAHNGIISKYTPSIDRKDTNDTQEFIKKFFVPFYKLDKNFYKIKDIQKALDDVTGSKLAILDKDDTLTLIGDYENENGVYYSNTTYRYSYSRYNYSDNWYDRYTKKSDEKKEENIPLNDGTDILDEGKYIDYDYFYPLKKGEYYKLPFGNITKVWSDNIYYYDFETASLYYKSSKTGDFTYLSSNVDVYDEFCEELV